MLWLSCGHAYCFTAGVFWFFFFEVWFNPGVILGTKSTKAAWTPSSTLSPPSSDGTPAHLDYCRAPHVCIMQPCLVLLKPHRGGVQYGPHFNTRHYNENNCKSIAITRTVGVLLGIQVRAVHRCREGQLWAVLMYIPTTFSVAHAFSNLDTAIVRLLRLINLYFCCCTGNCVMHHVRLYHLLCKKQLWIQPFVFAAE